jgi:tripartite-type tricarboxylate transporter receptor subunit TctC
LPQSVQDLIALAKSNPGQINFASDGTGNRLASELLKAQAQIGIVNVPYKGTSQALGDLVAGQVQIMMASALSAIPQIKAGKLRGLAVTSTKRAAVLPDLPTVAEAGLLGYASTSWHGVLVPAHTPKPIVMRLHDEITKALHQSEVNERLKSLGFEVVASTPEQFASHIQSERTKYDKLIRQIGLRAE